MEKKSVKKLLIVLATVLGLAAAAFCAYMGINAYRLKNCTHENWDNGVCSFCGHICVHDWVNGACSSCGTPCAHVWEDGSCRLCGMRCRHAWERGVCAVCGTVCAHEDYENGVCAQCAAACRHQWEQGVCTVCGMACPHIQHDTAGLCTLCGVKQVHHYIAGTCECGAKPIVYTEPLPKEFYAPCSEPGSITAVNYYAPFYAVPSVTVGKVMSIYLPYGYNEHEKYNVLVMVHGAEGDNGDWMEKTFVMKDGTQICMRNLYDNMIQQRIIEPLIIVAPYTDSYVFGGGFMDTGPEQLSPELRECILPYVIDNYSTYAEDSSEEQMQAAREHFGIGGCSNGALYAYNAGLVGNLDILSNFICLSGCNNASGAVQTLESQPYSVGYLYAGAGVTDAQKENSLNGYDYIVSNSPGLIEGENAQFVLIKDRHTWSTWSTLFFNAAQLMFPNG